jgi:hypothetical protein
MQTDSNQVVVSSVPAARLDLDALNRAVLDVQGTVHNAMQLPRIGAALRYPVPPDPSTAFSYSTPRRFPTHSRRDY